MKRLTRMTGNNYALDTNIVIDLFKGDEQVVESFNKARLVYLPLPTVAELYFGAENSKRKQHHIKQIEKLLELTVLLNTKTDIKIIRQNQNRVKKKRNTHSRK